MRKKSGFSMRTGTVRPAKPSPDGGLFRDENLTEMFGSVENAARILGIPAENTCRPELRNEMLGQEEAKAEQLGKAATTVFCWLYRMARSACRRSKIEAEHLPMLHALEKSQEVNLTDLAEQVAVHPTTVRRQMNALEKNGVGIVRPGRLKKKKAMIPKIIAPGREELSRCRAKIASELKVGWDFTTGEGEELAKALERLLAVAKAAPR